MGQSSKLIIHLKQHTPLLHFQHGQYGATLRATEVKPRLDKFIKEKVGADEKLKYCFIGDSKALDYKMKIEIDTSKKRGEYLVCSYLNTKDLRRTSDMPTIIAKSPYFAQEEANKTIVVKDKDKECRYFIEEEWKMISKKGLSWTDISVTFFSLNQIVLDYLDQYVEEFFLCSNFGTRSDKGFGCFTVCEKNKRPIHLSDDTIVQVLKQNFDFVYQKEKSFNDIWSIFSVIANDYRLIKSGSSYGEYKKSGFFHYATDKTSYRWDKPYIKSRLLPKLREQRKYLYVKDKANAMIKTYVDNSKFVRAFLGLTDNYMFQVLNKNYQFVKKEEIKVEVKSIDETIQRFPSPLLFKIIDKNIYLVGKEYSIKLIENKLFSLMYESESIGELSTPENFDLEDFLHYVLMVKYGEELKYKELKNKYGDKR